MHSPTVKERIRAVVAPNYDDVGTCKLANDPWICLILAPLFLLLPFHTLVECRHKAGTASLSSSSSIVAIARFLGDANRCHGWLWQSRRGQQKGQLLFCANQHHQASLRHRFVALHVSRRAVNGRAVQRL